MGDLMKLTINKSVNVAEQDGELILLHMKSGKLYGLDEVGTMIWKRIEMGDAMEQILEYLVGEFPRVQVEQLQKDVTNLIKQLIKCKLIQG